MFICHHIQLIPIPLWRTQLQLVHWWRSFGPHHHPHHQHQAQVIIWLPLAGVCVCVSVCTNRLKCGCSVSIVANLSCVCTHSEDYSSDRKYSYTRSDSRYDGCMQHLWVYRNILALSRVTCGSLCQQHHQSIYLHDSIQEQQVFSDIKYMAGFNIVTVTPGNL